MALILLPCEIYHREFDAKLLLSIYLSSYYDHSVIIGYDKYFTQLTKEAGSCLLLDKSLSSIMYQARIAMTKFNNGKVMVSDEEGINNILNPARYDSMFARIDPRAVNAVDSYICWGKLDKQIFSGVSGLRSKMITLGTPRSDLLNDIGKSYFKGLTNALISVFARYIIVSDNMPIERLGFQGIPRFNISDKRHNKLIKEYEAWKNEATNNRQIFTQILLETIARFPDITFIIRPHPISSPKWWHEHFGSFSNVSIINMHSIDPWIHGCSALISMGCTTGLQAIIAKKPVLEICSDTDSSNSLSAKVATMKASSSAELSEYIQLLLCEPDLYTLQNHTRLSKYWMFANKSTVRLYGEHINQLAKSLPNFNEKDSHLICSDLLINSSKWPQVPSLELLKIKLKAAINALKCTESIRLESLRRGLWLVTSNKHPDK